MLLLSKLLYDSQLEAYKK